MMRRAMTTTVAFIGVMLLTVLAGVTPTHAEGLSPWFHLASVSRPGNLQPEVAKNEVQQLTVSATKGDVFLANSERLEKGELLFATLPYNASAEQVQEALATKVYPSRRVIVTGGPGDEAGTKPYIVTFPDQSVQPLFASGEVAVEFGGEALSCEGATGSGCRGEGVVSELERGAAGKDHIAVTAINVGDATVDAESTPVKVIDKLPPGVTAVSVEGNSLSNDNENHGAVECATKSAHEVECTFVGTFEEKNGNKEETKIVPKTLPPYTQIEAVIDVAVEPGAAPGEFNETSVFGGGAPTARAKHPITIAKEPGEPTPFGVESFEQTFEEVGGERTPRRARTRSSSRRRSS